MIADAESRRRRLWTALAALVSLPLVAVLCATLWVAPFPISDSIGHFEDVARRPATAFLLPSSAYYRPLFYITLSAAWHGAASIGDALTAVRFLHIVPIVALVALLLGHARPRNAVQSGAAMLAVAVLIGAPGFRDNLELPLSYTIVGMPAVLGIWMLLERPPGAWRTAAILVLALIAIGFKEQGLVVLPLVAAAWWLRAPGATGRMAAAAVLMGVVYVAFRLAYHDERLPLFEQDVGFGFDRMSASDAEARFGSFPIAIFVYSGLSTIGSLLFAEPTEGVFRIAYALREGNALPWHLVHVASSVTLTGVIAWWGVGALRHHGRSSPDGRLFLLMLVVLAATGALSFNYSRDRLGGMAVPLYAVAAYHAVQVLAQQASRNVARAAAATILLGLLATGWQLRALYTLENTRQRAINTEREWSTRFQVRREEFTDRMVYTRILDAMLQQGTNPDAIRRTRYPRWMTRLLGEY
jgi:hypothetical protein